MYTHQPAHIADLLEQAARFADRQWTQNCYARNALGNAIPWQDRAAVQFCAAGRLFKTAPKVDLYGPVAEHIPGCAANLNKWNDAPGRTPEQVRRLFRQTAAALREEAAAAP